MRERGPHVDLHAGWQDVSGAVVAATVNDSNGVDFGGAESGRAKTRGGPRRLDDREACRVRGGFLIGGHSTPLKGFKP